MQGGIAALQFTVSKVYKDWVLGDVAVLVFIVRNVGMAPAHSIRDQLEIGSLKADLLNIEGRGFGSLASNEEGVLEYSVDLSVTDASEYGPVEATLRLVSYDARGEHILSSRIHAEFRPGGVRIASRPDEIG